MKEGGGSRIPDKEICMFIYVHMIIDHEGRKEGGGSRIARKSRLLGRGGNGSQLDSHDHHHYHPHQGRLNLANLVLSWTLGWFGWTLVWVGGPASSNKDRELGHDKTTRTNKSQRFISCSH